MSPRLWAWGAENLQLRVLVVSIVGDATGDGKFVTGIHNSVSPEHSPGTRVHGYVH
jgi:hypothetical protein